MNYIKNTFKENLEKFSEYQLSGLKYNGSTLEEIKNAKKNNESWTRPYCIIPRRETELFKNELKEFSEYYSKYPKYSNNKQIYKTDEEYKQYIKFIKETAVNCSGNCGYKVCPWCNHCKVTHQKNGCSNEKWNMIKTKYGTWRRYFMDTFYDPYNQDKLTKHENAIYHSYFDRINSNLYFRHCPCNQILYDNDSEDKVIKILKYYDSRLLDLNIQKIESVK